MSNLLFLGGDLIPVDPRVTEHALQFSAL